MSVNRALGRLAAVLPLTLLLAAPVSAVAEPAWTAGPCESAEGVTVAADFHGAGRAELDVRCARGFSADARAALERAGFAVQSGEQDGPYDDKNYVCRIEGLPAGDSCVSHEEGEPFWKVWRVGVAPVAWRGTGTSGGPAELAVCPGSLVGFSFGVGTPESPNSMSAAPEQIIGRPGWLPPVC